VEEGRGVILCVGLAGLRKAQEASVRIADLLFEIRDSGHPDLGVLLLVTPPQHLVPHNFNLRTIGHEWSASYCHM
jgi:hypothetical protein